MPDQVRHDGLRVQPVSSRGFRAGGFASFEDEESQGKEEGEGERDGGQEEGGQSRIFRDKPEARQSERDAA
jgi:hypothetical protein